MFNNIQIHPDLDFRLTDGRAVITVKRDTGILFVYFVNITGYIRAEKNADPFFIIVGGITTLSAIIAFIYSIYLIITGAHLFLNHMYRNIPGLIFSG